MKDDAHVKVITPADEKSNIGKNQYDIENGSRLRRYLKASGADLDSADGDDNRGAGEAITESRFARIMQGKRLMKRVKWPATDCSGDEPQDVEVGIVVLTEEELEEAAIAASEWLRPARDSLDTLAYGERLARESAIQVLWRAVLDAETRRPFALNPDELRKWVPARVLDWLWIQYRDHQEDLSPLSSLLLSEKEQDEIVDALKKNPEDTELDHYASPTLRQLLRRFATSHTTNSQSSKS